MKSLIVVAALGLGAGAVAVTLTIQANRFAFTSFGQKAPAVPELQLPSPEPATAPAALMPATPSRMVRISEVTVVGRLGPPRAVAQLSTNTPARMRAATVARVVHEPPPPVDTVISAPCVDGEYRMLDENRGVRLMCPGK